MFSRIGDDAFWLSYINKLASGELHATIHIAIFSEPFLTSIINGSKTIDSRFSRVRCAPFRGVNAGDVILIKEAGGPVRAISRAGETAYFCLGHNRVGEIRRRYGERICADDAFWEMQESARYATIIELSHTIVIDPLHVAKRDRRGWVTMCGRQQTFAFEAQ